MDILGQVYNYQFQIRYCVLDLLFEWIDGYYYFDFKINFNFIKELFVFVKDEVSFYFIFVYFFMFLVLGKVILWYIIDILFLVRKFQIMFGFRKGFLGEIVRLIVMFFRYGLYVCLQ